MRFALRHLLASAAILIAFGVASTGATAQAANRYPAVFEQAFLRSCSATSGGKTAMCRCALRWIERRYPYRRIIAIYLHDTARMRRVMFSAVFACTR